MNRALSMLGGLAIAGAMIGAPLATAAPNGNQLLAKGTVSENLGGAPHDWTISFNIHARGDGKSSEVDITPGTGAATTTFDGSVCAGSYTDPILGGTDVYVVGKVLSGPQLYGSPYQVYVVHEGGPLGADRSWSVPVVLPDLASAQSYCASFPAITPAFQVDAASNVLFKV